MRSVEITVQTGSRRGLFDITADCERFVAGTGDGLLTIFVPHATAGVVIMELGAGSDDDLLAALERLLPHDERWRHRHGSPGHGADHVLPLLAPPSITIPVIATVGFVSARGSRSPCSTRTSTIPAGRSC